MNEYGEVCGAHLSNNERWGQPQLLWCQQKQRWANPRYVEYFMADDTSRNRQSPMTSAPPQPFEIPDTSKSRAFMARNPMFPAPFAKLLDLSNKSFARNPRDNDHREHICFWLGHTCRHDFLEVAFLAINGYGARATKILLRPYQPP